MALTYDVFNTHSVSVFVVLCFVLRRMRAPLAPGGGPRRGFVGTMGSNPNSRIQHRETMGKHTLKGKSDFRAIFCDRRVPSVTNVQKEQNGYNGPSKSLCFHQVWGQSPKCEKNMNYILLTYRILDNEIQVHIHWLRKLYQRGSCPFFPRLRKIKKLWIIAVRSRRSRFERWKILGSWSLGFGFLEINSWEGYGQSPSVAYSQRTSDFR